MYDDDRNEDIAVRPMELPEPCAPPMWKAAVEESPKCMGPAPHWSDAIPKCRPFGDERYERGNKVREANKQAQTVAAYIKLNAMQKLLPGRKISVALCIGDTVIKVPLSENTVDNVVREFKEMALIALKDADIN